MQLSIYSCSYVSQACPLTIFMTLTNRKWAAELSYVNRSHDLLLMCCDPNFNVLGGSSTVGHTYKDSIGVLFWVERGWMVPIG